MNKKSKKLLCVVLSMLLLITAMIPVQAKTDKELKDIENHWAKEAIKSMVQNGIITGYPDGTFKPNENLTREQFAKLIAATFGLKQDLPETPTFRDITPKRWSYIPIETCKDYLTGYFPPNGTPFFDPESDATREDVAVALVRAMNLKDDIDANYILEDKFEDYKQISPKLKEEVALAVTNELITGFPDNTFRPLEPVTRGQVATLLYRILKNSYFNTKPEEITIDFTTFDETTKDSFFIISGFTNADTMYINNKKIPINSTSFLETLNLTELGKNNFTFKLTKGKTEETIVKTTNFIYAKPTIEFYDNVVIPKVSYEDSLYIQGTAKENNDWIYAPKLTINDQEIEVKGFGIFEAKLRLSEGMNYFTFKAVDSYNQITEKTYEIEYKIPAPEITFKEYKTITDKPYTTIEGYVIDTLDQKPRMALNGKEMYIMDKGYFSENLSLEEGTNNFKFEAINKSGKITTKDITVTYEKPIPIEELIKENPKPAEENPEYALLFDENQLIGYTGNPVNIVLPDTTTSIAAQAFKDCNTLESITMPDSIKEMGAEVFKNCKNLKKVVLSNNLEILPFQTFGYCENLQEVSFGKFLRVIRTEAFRGAKSLKQVTFNEAIGMIEAHAFRECYLLKDVYFISKSAPAMGLYVFSYVDPMPVIHTPEDSINYTEKWFNYFKN